jgi:hypothetical protein
MANHMNGRSERWTEAEMQRLLSLKALGLSEEEIACAMGRTLNAINTRLKFLKLTPEQREARRARYRNADRERRKQDRVPIARNPHRPTESMVMERDRRFGMDRTIGQLLLGEPLPGQSALDKRNRELSHGAN